MSTHDPDGFPADAQPTRRALLASPFAAAALAACSTSTAPPSAEGAEMTGGCPITGLGQQPAASTRHTAAGVMDNGYWWPEQLNLQILHQNTPAANPMGKDFRYADAFKKLDLAALKTDIAAMLTTSQDWWPADYGNYGGLFIRLAWHSAGTYRTADGRGGAADGTIRFAPLNSWPDNGNLDKARRLLWPIKRKYGSSISWADLMILTGNVALETMGFKTLGFAGGRDDVYEPQLDVVWGPESTFLGDQRHGEGRELANPLGATQMGLIYVNPEGPNGVPDPLLAARDIRTTFGRMAMNDEETVALIAGGHTLGKAHGAADPNQHVGREPEGASLEEQGLGWKNAFGKGHGADTITSGLEGAWTSTPVAWSTGYFDNLFRYEWELTRSPAGAQQWQPKGDAGRKVPDAHIDGKLHQPMMLTTDLALITDPAYRVIAKRFHEDPAAFDAAFARAWFKLTHRDMGPHGRLLGAEVPPAQSWQDGVPAVDHPLIDDADVTQLKAKVIATGLPTARLVATAWASAATFRGSDLRGGANGARIRLAPMKDWAANEPAQLQQALAKLAAIQAEFDAAQTGGKKVSLADLIVLAGCAAIEDAAKRAGHDVKVAVRPGRTDATQAMTDVASFAVLQPAADGFRNYAGKSADRPLPELFVDRAQLLTLSAPEMTVLVGGLRALGVTAGDGTLGVLTAKPGALTNDFFVNLLDMGVAWRKDPQAADVYQGVSRQTGAVEWTASAVDLVFGSNAQLRAIAEVYASDDAKAKFVADFVAAWTKVMELDRFDLR